MEIIAGLFICSAIFILGAIVASVQSTLRDIHTEIKRFNDYNKRLK